MCPKSSISIGALSCERDFAMFNTWSLFGLRLNYVENMHVHYWHLIPAA